MNRTVPMEEIIAFDNTPGALDLLKQYQQKRPANHAQLIEILRHIAYSGEQGFEAVASLHPDKDMLVGIFGNASAADVKVNTSSCDGDCGCGCSKKKGKVSGMAGMEYIDDGNLVTQADLNKAMNQNQHKSSDIPMLIIGGTLVVGIIALILKEK